MDVKGAKAQTCIARGFPPEPLEPERQLAPKEVRFVRDIPKTRSAKLMRRVIRAAYLGELPGNLSSLVNPDAVEEMLEAVLLEFCHSLTAESSHPAGANYRLMIAGLGEGLP